MSMCHDSHNVDMLVLGFNNRFGSDRLSDIADYQKEGEKVGITVMQATELPDMSSSIIRNLIIDKEIKKATEKLGYFYFLEGMVVKGKQIGRTIGFPTANLQPSTGKLIPPKGANATWRLSSFLLPNIPLLCLLRSVLPLCCQPLRSAKT